MPYIDQTTKSILETRLKEEGTGYAPINAGELNYIISCMADNMLEANCNYARMNEIVGALESAKAEFQRRVMAPYEDKKINENGDVYRKAHIKDKILYDE